MIEHATDQAVRTWLPQRFGRRKPDRIVDPLVEPVWIGTRVLVRVTETGVPEGAPADAALEPDLATEIRAAVAARSAVLDGYLTRQPTMGPNLGPLDEERPTVRGHATQLFVGDRGRERRELIAADRAAAAIEQSDAPLAFVAVDLLELDGFALVELPLLERKRLLDGVVIPTDLVRLGAYVRPPLGAWPRTWRRLGFQELALKAANSRYRPGAVNDDWTTIRIPR